MHGNLTRIFGLITAIFLYAASVRSLGYQDSETRTPPGQEEKTRLAPRTDDFAEPSAWRLGSSLLHAEVTNRTGEPVGRFEDIVYDPITGRPLFGVILSNKPAESGKFYAVPWSIVRGAVDAGANNGVYRAEIDAPRLNDVSSFTAARWPEFDNRIWAESIYREYGQKAFWDKANEPNVTVSEEQARWDRYPGRTVRLSALKGIDVKLDSAQKVGALADVAIDPANGRVIYALIGRRDRYFAVPWNAFALSADNRAAGVRGTADDFRDEVGFQPDRAPDLVGKVLTRAIHGRFNARPYWKNGGASAP